MRKSVSSVLPKVEGHCWLGDFDFDFRRQFAEIIIELGSMTKAQGLFLEVFVAPQVPRFLFGNSQAIEEIVCGLATHLLDKMDEGGIIVEVDSVAYRATGDHMLQVSLTATAPSLAALKRQKLHLLGDKDSSFSDNPFDAAMDLTRQLGGEIALKKDKEGSITYIFRAQFKEGAALVDDFADC